MYKTTTAAQAPDSLFVTTADEKGILEAIQASVVPTTIEDVVVLDSVSPQGEIPLGGHPGWKLLIDTLDTFSQEDHKYKSVIIDTASGLQGLCHQHTASMLYDGDMNNPQGFMNYQQGYLKAAEQFWNGQFLRSCNEITAKGLNVILICHCCTMAVPNLGGAEYECYAPELIRGAKKENIYEYTMKTVSAILYFGKQVITTTNEKKKRRVGSQINFIGVQDQGWYKAKNWYNLQNEIDMGDSAQETWSLLTSHLPV